MVDYEPVPFFQLFEVTVNCVYEEINDNLLFLSLLKVDFGVYDIFK